MKGQPSTIPEPRPDRQMFRAPAWQWNATGDVGWWTLPGWSDTLLDAQGLRLDEWRARGLLHEVKRSPHRVVYRVDLPAGAIYVKHFLVPGYREMFRQWFRRGKGRNEAKRSARLSALGVETIQPVALGEQRKRRFLFENYLVSPAIQGVTPLDRFLESELPVLDRSRRAAVRRGLAEALGEFTARMHDAGLFHADFHPGNLLVRLEGNRPHLAMIDLDSLRFRRRPGVRARIDNLAVFNHYFWIRCNRSDRARFLRAYVRTSSDRLSDTKGLARGIEATTRRWAERMWRRWGRRCTRTNKYFVARRRRQGWAVASRAIEPEWLDRLLLDPDAPFRDSGFRLLKKSRTALVGETTWRVDGEDKKVVYKRFNRKKWLEPLFSMLRPSRGWRSWRAAHHLASRGLPTPANLLILGRCEGGLVSRFGASETYLATLKAEPSITLAELFLRILPGLPPESRALVKRRITTSLARLIHTLHDRSLSDRDLKAANILVTGDPLGEEGFELSLIDLVGVRLLHPLPRNRRLQNLSRLHLSLASLPGWNRTDSLRFLIEYLPVGGRDRPTRKRWWRALARTGRRKVERNRRRGRILS